MKKWLDKLWGISPHNQNTIEEDTEKIIHFNEDNLIHQIPEPTVETKVNLKIHQITTVEINPEEIELLKFHHLIEILQNQEKISPNFIVPTSNPLELNFISKKLPEFKISSLSFESSFFNIKKLENKLLQDNFGLLRSFSTNENITSLNLSGFEI
jgi:GTPase SAR1 family protein